jgi:hypothetical protein
MTYPDNEIVTHSYKSQMLLNSVIGANTYVNSTTYDEAGQCGKSEMGWNSSCNRFCWTKASFFPHIHLS